MSKTPVFVRSTSDALMMIQSHPQLVLHRLALTATVFMEFERERPFHSLSGRFEVSDTYTKTYSVVQGVEVPGKIFHIKQDDPACTRLPDYKEEGDGGIIQNPIEAVHYRPTVSKEDQISTCTTVQIEDAAKLENERQIEVKSPSTYDSYKPILSSCYRKSN